MSLRHSGSADLRDLVLGMRPRVAGIVVPSARSAPDCWLWGKVEASRAARAAERDAAKQTVDLSPIHPRAQAAVQGVLEILDQGRAARGMPALYTKPAEDAERAPGGILLPRQ
jgi:hypothetical protein